MLDSGQLTEQIIGAAIEVHRAFGPGLLESICEDCFCHELHLRGIDFERQVDFPVVYKSVQMQRRLRLDLVVADTVVVEVKSVEKLSPVHEAQLLTYLRISGKHVGLLINFGAELIKDGIVRRVV
jgi:GxxExxY protein